MASSQSVLCPVLPSLHFSPILCFCSHMRAGLNRPTMAKSTVKLTIKLEGRLIQLSVSPDATTKDLKSLLQPITNVFPRGQKLIFKEVLELAGNTSKHLKVKRITPKNLQLTIRGDEELG